jgi:hypothetical protein
MAQDERTGIDFIDDFPFMLRYSKHSEPFFSNLLENGCSSQHLPPSSINTTFFDPLLPSRIFWRR